MELHTTGIAPITITGGYGTFDGLGEEFVWGPCWALGLRAGVKGRGLGLESGLGIGIDMWVELGLVGILKTCWVRSQP